MKKRILLIGYNYYPEYTGIGKYSGEMIHWLAQEGYDCTVITAYPYYPQWKVTDQYFKNRNWYSKEEFEFESGGRIVVHRCPMYIPSKPSGIKRMLLDFSFLFSASIQLIRLLFTKKIDLVIAVAPSFLVGLPAIVYKKVKGAKILYHIQDMQIEAARDLKMIKSDFVIKILFKIEDYILQRSDYVTTIGEEMVKKMRAKVGKDVFLLLNSVDTETLYPIQSRELIKHDFGFTADDKIVLYSGAIGEKQGLEAILYAAKALESQLNVKFVICGSGPYKQKLIALAESLRLSNVVFLPLQPTEKLNRFLNIADAHLVIQKMSASDLVMPSKLTSILAVGGLAIVTANSGSGLHTLVDKNKIGLLVESENQAALIEGIQEALTADHHALRLNARSFAENNLSIDSVMTNLEKLVGFKKYNLVS